MVAFVCFFIGAILGFGTGALVWRKNGINIETKINKVSDIVKNDVADIEK